MDNQSKKRKLEETSRQPNDSMFQKFMEIIMKKTPDVHFIFEEDNDTVKLPAHKDVLAASSKVFDAMFNGELKEEGDVNIVDASSAAFKELFYEHQVAQHGECCRGVETHRQIRCHQLFSNLR